MFSPTSIIWHRAHEFFPAPTRVPAKKSSRTQQGNKHLLATLTELTWGGDSRTKKNYYKARYEKIIVSFIG
jgi:hypothetical protein